MRVSPLAPFVDLYKPAVRIALNEEVFRWAVRNELDNLRKASYPPLPPATIKTAQLYAFRCMQRGDDV